MQPDGARRALGAVRVRPLPPVPRDRPGRAGWLRSFDEAIAVDVVALCDACTADGRTTADVEALVDSYADTLAAHARAAVEMGWATWRAANPHRN